MYRTYGRRNDAIVAYTFKAEQLCPTCMLAKLPTGDGEAFDGWDLAEGAHTMSVEDNLDQIAEAFGIDRMDERTFDTGDFPKVVLDAQLLENERCGECDEEL